MQLRDLVSYLSRGDARDDQFPDAGGEYWALCPFHADTHVGSFSVSEQGYHCFVCGASGGLKKLAAQLGVPAAPDSNRNGNSATAAPSGPEGCTLAGYAAAKRLPEGFLRGLGLSEGTERPTKGAAPISVLYIPYRDAQGQLITKRKRLALTKPAQGKDTRFKWPVGAKPPLYGLWRLDEIRRAGWVLLVEGESDCHTAWLHDLPALGVPGADAWKPAWAQDLAGLDIYVWQEPDKGGRDFVNSLAASFPTAHVLSHPTYKDLSAAYMADEKLPELVTALRRSAVAIAEVATKPPPGLTDLGNAERLVARHGADLLYSYPASSWYVWQRTHWERDAMGEVDRRAVDTVRAIYAEAADEPDSEERKKIAAWATRSEGENRISAMIARARSLRPVAPGAFDAEEWLFNCANGTLDLRTGELRPHRREDLMTKVAPVSYDPTARSAAWERYLAYAMEGDEEMIRFLARAVGSSLVGNARDEVLFFLHGKESAGKSTFIEAIKATMGPYAMTADFETFLARSFVSGGPRNDIARLAGARLVLSIEVEEGKKLATGLVKSLTGRDTITARFLHQEAFEFRPQMTLWLVANHAPEINASDGAIWRRVIRVPFERVVPPEERNPALKEELCDPARSGAAILAWAVQGCLDWQRQGLARPAKVTRATEELRQEMNPLADFVKECCVLSPTAYTPQAELHAQFEEWARETGRRVVNGKEWGEKLRDLGLKPSVLIKIQGKPTRCVVGVGLLSAQEDDDSLLMGPAHYTAPKGMDKPWTEPVEAEDEDDDDKPLF